MAPESQSPKKKLPVEIVQRLCAEAQADGVPCTELGRDCQVCERAILEARTPRNEAKRRD